MYCSRTSELMQLSQSTTFEPSDSPDLTPSQLAAWYRAVGGDYGVLFTDTPPSSIAFIYRSLGAYHSLQPAPSDDGYSTPAIPALKKQGFITWQTIQLLLGPQEHVAFIQKSLELFDVIDPQTKTAFPKVLPSTCFPEKPDETMEEWYESVATRLKREAEAEEARGPHTENHPGVRTSTDMSGDGSSADEKQGAFKYFEDPMYRKARPRPAFMRHVSKDQVRDERERATTSRVRQFLHPFTRKKSHLPGRYGDDYSDEDATPIATHPPSAPRYPSHKRPHAPRRESSLSSTDSDSDDQPSSRRRSPVHSDRRPAPRPLSPHEYFPKYREAPRYSPQHVPAEKVDNRHSSAPPHPVYGPTEAPLFATHVAQLQARNHYARPTLAPRSSYRPEQPSVRYGMHSTPVSPPHGAEPAYAPHRDSYRSREGDGYDHSAHAQRRRSTEDSAYARERERDRERDNGRTRSHDRMKDEWNGRERWGSREHSRDRRHEREGERRHGSHRYVSGVQDGVSGRRYPVV
jgi:hypothetical protein